MKALRIGINSGTSLLILFLSVAVQSATNHSPLYSQWMASSIASRKQGILTGQEGSSGLLQAGFVQKAFRSLVAQYPDHDTARTFSAYITASVDSVVPLLQNATLDTSYPLDRLSNGNAMIALNKETGNTTYASTLNALRRSIDLQPRNRAGGLWYYVYPGWSYLDGMYSFAPFATQYATEVNASNVDSAFQDVTLQLELLFSHCHDNITRLLVHGYDYEKTAVWANPVTGASSYVWGRSLGWYMMALVDTLEILSPYRRMQQWELLLERFMKLSAALVQAVDPVSGAWWQIPTKSGERGTTLSRVGVLCSCMCC
jgi:hypothetical protein